MNDKGPPAIRCLVADDHPAVLRAVTAYLAESGIEVVASAGDGDEALAKIEIFAPSVAVLDLRMPRLTGIEVTAQAARTAPETAVILYSGFGDAALLTDALDAGAKGFLLKTAPLVDLVRAIETVAEGQVYVDAVLGGALIGADATELPNLTQRERDTLRMLASGFTNEQIGRALFISPETVKTHVRKAMVKLGADTRTQAVATALRASLIS
jgi:DNA-binding NarL/FixJ family response regulator